jgi:methionine salvage enolase-phosphatase E1
MKTVPVSNNLMREALMCSKDTKSQEELVELALTEFVAKRKQKTLKDLKGEIEFSEGYDYKQMRNL